MKFFNIIADTFRECLGKKILMAFAGVSTLGIIGLFFSIDVDIQGTQAAVSAFFGHETNLVRLSQLQEGVAKAEAAFAMALYTAGIFFSLFATADIFPSLLTRGRVELYLARPISRATILLGKYAGICLFIALNITYALSGVWLVLGLKTGVWHFPFFYAVGTIIFMSVILYAIMIFISIYARSAAVSIIILYFMIFLSPILANRESLIFARNSIFREILDGLYWIIPKYAELAMTTVNLVAENPVESWTPVASSLVTGLVVLNAAVYVFSRKDL